MIRWPSFFLLTALCGCSTLHGVHVEPLAVSAQKPNQVATFLRVTEDGEPLAGLTAEQFAVYEDEQALARSQAQPTLLDPEIAAAHHTLLLVDNSLATDAAVRKELASAISIFVERVRTVEPVAVYAFDGGAEIRLVAEFARARKAPAPDVRRLAQIVPADTSRNLNGALMQGTERLEALLAREQRPLRLGTLVVFSGGPDLAGRNSASDMEQALRERDHAVLGIRIGGDSSALAAVSESDSIDAHSAETLSLAFEDAAHRVVARHGQYYLLAYCSPARAGTRRLRLEVRAPAKDGSDRIGEASAEFDASGFTAGCEAKALPRFAPRRKND